MRSRPAVDDDLRLFVLALIWDLTLGEPPAPMHPVVWMGRVAGWLERRAPGGGRVTQVLWGGAMAMGPPLLYAALARYAPRALRRCPRVVSLLVGAWLLKGTFAVCELRRAAERVRLALAVDDLDAARAGLRALVSRDVTGLDAPAIAAAATESLAENLGDSIVAPFLAYALWGTPGALAYRAANTLDAMIGYRGRYEWLGKPAARLDDLLNLLPARVAAGLIILAAAVAGEDARAAWVTMRRDSGKTASPNAGWPMAAMAGALGVELEKRGHYRLGAGAGAATAATIARADRLVTLATAGGAGLILALRRAGRGAKGEG